MDRDYTLVELIELLTHAIGERQKSVIEEYESSGLTIKQVDYLEAVGRMGNPSMSDLAEDLGLSKPSVTAIVEKLSHDGFIIKTPSDTDKRSFHVHLTEKGRDIITMHDAIHNNIAEIFTKTLDGRELEELVTLLNRVVKRLA